MNIFNYLRQFFDDPAYRSGTLDLDPGSPSTAGTPPSRC